MAEYIERGEAIKAIRDYNGYFQDQISTENMILKLECENALNDMESSDVAPVRHGRWEVCDYVEPDIHGFGTIRYANAGLKCTNCVHVFKKDLLWKDNYCPNCGTKMDLEAPPHV